MPKFSFPPTKRLTLHASRYFLPFAQKGLPTIQAQTLQTGQSSSVLVIFILIVVFAVMLIGGGNALFSGNMPSSVIDPDPTGNPEGNNPPGAGTPTATPTPAWTIDYTLEACTTEGGTGLKKGKVIGKGTINGYILIMKDVNGSFVQEGVARKFVFPKTSWPLELSNLKGFNTKNWKLMLYSGGIENNGNFSGGNLEATKDGTATICP